MKKTLAILTLALLLLAMAACGAGDEKGAVIGSVNGVNIYQSEYDHYLSDYFDYYYTYYSENYGIDLSDQSVIDAYMPTFLAALEYYSWQHCVEAVLIRQIAEKEFGMTYANEFAESFLPYGELRTVETNSIVAQIASSEDVDAAASEAARAAYEADPKEYRGTSHILIACSEEEQADPATLAAAYEQACQVIQLLNGGADFEEMISAYSAESNTSYDPIDAEGNMIDGSATFVKEYADGAFSLAQEGDITQEPVLSTFGYHIIRLNSIVDTYEEAEPYLVSLETYFSDLLQRYKDEAEVVCNLDFKYYGKEEAADETADDGASDAESQDDGAEEAEDAEENQ